MHQVRALRASETNPLKTDSLRLLLSGVVRQIKIYKKRFYCIIIYPMSKHEKLLVQILRGTSDANIPFDGLYSLLKHIGFEERIKGSHHIFTKHGVEEILNLQPKGTKSKPYQVKQARM